MLQNEPSVAKFRFDTAENEVSEVDNLTILAIFMNFVMNKASANTGTPTTTTARRTTPPSTSARTRRIRSGARP